MSAGTGAGHDATVSSIASSIECERGVRTADGKGSPDSVDVGGFQALPRRLPATTEGVVGAPEFVREQEESIAGALPIPREVPLITVGGHYLLLDDER